MLDKAIKFFITLTCAIVGGAAFHQVSPFVISYINLEFFQINTGIFRLTMANLVCILVGATVGGLTGWFVSPFLINRLKKFTSFVEKQLSKMPINDVIAGAVGLAIGLIIANLLGSAFARIPIVGNYIPIIFSIVLGYLGVKITIKKRKEITGSFDFIKEILRNREADKAAKETKEVTAPEKPVEEPVKEPAQEETPPVERAKVNLVKLKEHKDKNYKLLDTNVIIDGRIADICNTGFLEGTILIPVFVLEELQYIADSSDTLRRVRGRRGLDILQKIREDSSLEVEIMNIDFDDVQGVDSKLVRLAQKIGGKIITNDFNLNKVAQLRGVDVLNINELSNAVKPVVIPGETMKVQVVKDGKEPGQGVAYLDDGTMIVIENGHRYLSRTISVEVTSALQTSAGRMIFAKPR
ncbi:MAG: PIN/TRAM domain-containing protein [Selenomonadaceae bacterium]|nr:PIN/TRAM domain-containing protein [Selenomonadaceae bacterium]